MNRVKEKLRAGEIVFGQMILEFFVPGIGPILSAAGMEFVIFDMEHGRCDIALAASMIASCRGSDIVPLVRVPDAGAVPLSRVLDLGARGVMVPRVETRAQMEDAVAELKYAPEGRRGVALGLAHDMYRPQGAPYFPQANADTMVIALLETVRGFENLDEIAAVPGIDVLWMGHYDLTTSMGIPGQFDHPRFLAAMDALVDRAKRHNLAAGFLPPTPADTIHWIGKGFRAISLGSDVGVYGHGIREFHNAVTAGLGR